MRALALYQGEGVGMTICRRFETWQKVLRPGRHALTERLAGEA
jgi:hypothetical protein